MLSLLALGKEIPSSVRLLRAQATQLLVVDGTEVINRQDIPLKGQIDLFVPILFMYYERNDRVEENELYLPAEASQCLHIPHT